MVRLKGTYRLSGTVHEAGSGIPLGDAQIEVANTLIAPVSTSRFNGFYTLVGVPADAEIHISKEGYKPEIQRLRLTGNLHQNFTLTLEHPRLEIAGTYTLEITAECRGDFPEELKVRRYATTLRQDGARLEASLTGATFAVSPYSDRAGDRLRGTLEAFRAVFWLQPV